MSILDLKDDKLSMEMQQILFDIGVTFIRVYPVFITLLTLCFKIANRAIKDLLRSPYSLYTFIYVNYRFLPETRNRYICICDSLYR